MEGGSSVRIDGRHKFVMKTPTPDGWVIDSCLTLFGPGSGEAAGFSAGDLRSGSRAGAANHRPVIFSSTSHTATCYAAYSIS